MKRDGIKSYLPMAGVFAASFAVYLYTLCPTVYWDDAGELIAACYTLGIPHPPGHPLYAILGKLFTLIPVGSPAYRVNLMSAFFGALSCGVLFQLVRELIERDEDLARFGAFAGAAAALSMAFSGIMWDQSVLAETTTLHLFFMLLVTLMAFRIDASGADEPGLTRRLLIFSFVFGLSFTNHVAGLFFAPSLAFILLYRLRLGLFRPGRLFLMLFLFALGLSVYGYLPVASRFDPLVDWGNPENLHNFWWVVSARQYSSDLVSFPTAAGLALGLRSVFGVFLSNLTPIGCALALVGAWGLWKTRKQVVVYGLIIIFILFYTSLNSAFISVYLLPAVLMLAIWLGCGVAMLCGRAESIAHSFEGGRGRLLARAGHIVAALLVLSLFLLHFSENNKRRYTHARDYGIELLSSLPQDAVLITGTADPLFISWYLQYCEGYRADVKVISRNALHRPGYMEQIHRQYPELDLPERFEYKDAAGSPSRADEGRQALISYANSYFKQFYELNSDEFAIFWEGIEAGQPLIERLEPCGLVFRIPPPDEEAGSRCSSPPDALEIAEKIGRDPAAGKIYGNHFFNFGIFYQRRADMPQARRYYEDALRLRPDDARPHNNIGAMLMGQGRAEEAFDRFLEAFRLDPNSATSNHNVGQALLDRGEAREALPYFRRAIALNPGKFEDYHSLGLCYSAAGQHRRAVEMFRQALALRPGSAESLSALEAASLRLGETENAEKQQNAAIKIEPENAKN